jgi:hypothetical protein
MPNRRDRSILVLASVAVILLASGAARAQSITFPSSSGQYPTRLVNGQVAAGRPVNLNPTGINYADCVADMVFQYDVLLSGFPGTSDSIQVWATNNTDPSAGCVFDGPRGIPDPETATCWMVNPPLTEPGQTSYQINIPVRALVGPQTGSIPTAGTVVTDEGLGACQTQTSFAATSITVWFVVVGSNGQGDTNATSYAAPIITADLVGPPAPTGAMIGPGDTLFNVSWTPNGDADTAGYDVFIDPPLGGAPVDAAGVTLVPRTLYCPETGAPAVMSDAAATAASSDATDPDAEGVGAESIADSAAESGTADSGCFSINGGASAPPSVASTCTSLVLTTTSFLVGASTEVVESEAAVAAADADTDAEGGTVVTPAVIPEGSGGISAIPCQYLVGASCAAGSPAYTNTGLSTVTGPTGSGYTIKSLTNGATYDVVVAAVDGSGNVGPASNCASDYPAVVDDFFTLYREAGGRAGGSFCALQAVGEPAGAPIVGVAFSVLAFTVARRRRRNRR